MATRKSIEHSLHVLSGGNEPIVTEADYNASLMRAMNWYNTHRDEKQLRSYAEQYVKHNDELKHYVKSLSSASFIDIKSIAVIGRLIKRDQFIQDKDKESIHEMVKTIHANHIKVKTKPVVKTVDKTTPVSSIQDRIKDSARVHSGDIEDAIDAFLVNYQSDFSLKTYLLTNQISGAVTKKIEERYQRLLDELTGAMTGKDEQLKEGYSNFTKMELKKFHQFVSQLVADCTQRVVTAKHDRKPRAKKVKPAGVIVSKVKYLKEFPELNLKSVSPTAIVGASELWIYNTDTRKLTVFRGADGGPLTVHGMSISNYDTVKSETKILRKPAEFFKKLSSTGKRAMNNAWKEIKAKPATPKSRITEDTILFAVN